MSLKRKRYEDEAAVAPNFPTQVKRPCHSALDRTKTFQTPLADSDSVQSEPLRNLDDSCGGETKLSPDVLKRVPGGIDIVSTWVETHHLPESLAMPASQSSSSSNRKRARTGSSRSPAAASTSASSVYDLQVPQILMDNGIYGPADSQAPKNLEDIRDKMTQARASLSPSKYPDSKWTKFVQENDWATNEADITAKCVPFFTEGSQYLSSNNSWFNHLEPLVGPEYKLPAPKPDVSTGLAPKQFHPEVRRNLASLIVPTNSTGPVLVNDFIEVKGPHGTSASLLTQATHNGGAGARAMHASRSFRSDTPLKPDGTARTYHTAIHGGAGTVSFHVSHAQEGDSLEQPVTYHTFRVAAECALGSPEQFRRAISIHRNFREMAAQDREEAARLANSKVQAGRGCSLDSTHSLPATASHCNTAHVSTTPTSRSAQVADQRHFYSVRDSRGFHADLTECCQTKEGALNSSCSHGNSEAASAPAGMHTCSHAAPSTNTVGQQRHGSSE